MRLAKWVPLPTPLRVGDRVMAVQINAEDEDDRLMGRTGGRVDRIEGEYAVVSFDPSPGLTREATEEAVRAIDGGPVIPGAGTLAVIRVR